MHVELKCIINIALKLVLPTWLKFIIVLAFNRDFFTSYSQCNKLGLLNKLWIKNHNVSWWCFIMDILIAMAGEKHHLESWPNVSVNVIIFLQHYGFKEYSALLKVNRKSLFYICDSHHPWVLANLLWGGVYAMRKTRNHEPFVKGVTGQPLWMEIAGKNLNFLFRSPEVKIWGLMADE